MANNFPSLSPVSFAELNDWPADNHLEAFDAFCVTAKRMIEVPYKTRKLGADAKQLVNLSKHALENIDEYRSAPRAFFETHFTPHFVQPDNNQETGFLTGYFEPIVEASKNRSPDFSVPLYKRPPDLIELTDENRPKNLPTSYRFARQNGGLLEEYFDRGDIQAGALEGQNLELVWVRNLIDAFFIHVQGSAKLRLIEGGEMRVTYAAKSGHPYSSLGRILCETLKLPLSKMTADTLRNWMLANTSTLPEFLKQNRSYIFFEEVLGLSSHQGPIAAAKVPLVAGRSLAIDRTLHTFGTPVWIATKGNFPENNAPLKRLMIAHDTGSAIVGSARGDIFIGSGDHADHIAGRVQHQTDFFTLLPKETM